MSRLAASALRARPARAASRQDNRQEKWARCVAQLGPNFVFRRLTCCRNIDQCKQTLTKLKILPPVAPQAPTLGSVLASPAREGQEYQLSCATFGGNPEPNITWFRNEQLLQPSVSSGHRVEQTRANGTTTSTLTWLPTIDDHQASYKCQVWNKAMGPLQSYERETRLRVECKYTTLALDFSLRVHIDLAERDCSQTQTNFVTSAMLEAQVTNGCSCEHIDRTQHVVSVRNFFSFSLSLACLLTLKPFGHSQLLPGHKFAWHLFRQPPAATTVGPRLTAPAAVGR